MIEVAGTRVSKLPALTSIRFFAALAVVVAHFGTSHATPTSWLGARAQALGLNGVLAVPFFFILSGFVLSYTYLSPEGSLRGSRRNFLVARLARVYPVYFVSLLLGLSFWLSLHPHDIVSTTFKMVTLTYGWFSASAPQWNPPSWSLSTELLLYLAFPLLLPTIARRKSTLGFLVCWLAAVLPALLWVNGSLPAVPVTLVVFLGEFGTGICMGLAYCRGLRSPIGTRWLVPIVVLTCSIAPMFSPFEILITYALIVPLFALLVLSAASVRSGVLVHPGLLLLGEASYGLYILHFPIWQTLFPSQSPNKGIHNIEDLVRVFAYTVFAVSASVLSYRYFETPSRVWLRRVLSAQAVSQQ